jgi:CRISPR-associated protein Cas2
MRQGYVVTYDIADPKRLRQVYKILRGYGAHLQLSVFQCELDERERVELLVKLRAEINHQVDQVLFIDIGPVDGRGASAIEAIGRPYLPEAGGAVVA